MTRKLIQFFIVGLLASALTLSMAQAITEDMAPQTPLDGLIAVFNPPVQDGDSAVEVPSEQPCNCKVWLEYGTSTRVGCVGFNPSYHMYSNGGLDVWVEMRERDCKNGWCDNDPWCEKVGEPCKFTYDLYVTWMNTTGANVDLFNMPGGLGYILTPGFHLGADDAIYVGTLSGQSCGTYAQARLVLVWQDGTTHNDYINAGCNSCGDADTEG